MTLKLTIRKFSIKKFQMVRPPKQFVRESLKFCPANLKSSKVKKKKESFDLQNIPPFII